MEQEKIETVIDLDALSYFYNKIIDKINDVSHENLNLENGTGNGSTAQKDFTVEYYVDEVASNGETVQVLKKVKVRGGVADGAGSIAIGGLRYDKVNEENDNFGESPTRAGGIQSFAGGGSSHALGPFSFAFGRDADAYQLGSVAFGGNTIAGYDAINEVTYDENGNAIRTSHSYYDESFAFATGFYTHALGVYSFTGGKSTEAIGEGSVSFGLENKSIGNYSISFGYKNKANGLYSSVFGSNNTISGENSASFGANNNLSGNNNFSVGSGNILTQSGSIVLGNRNEDHDGSEILNETTGFYEKPTYKNSILIGNELISSRNNQVVVGYYNESASDAIFIVGTGHENTTYNRFERGNALEVSADRSVRVFKAPVASYDVARLEEIESRLPISGGTITGSLTVTEKVKATTIEIDDLLINGKTDFNGTSSFKGSTTFIGDLSFGKEAQVTSDMDIEGNLTANSLTVRNDLKIEKDLYVDGTIHANVSVKDITGETLILGKDESDSKTGLISVEENKTVIAHAKWDSEQKEISEGASIVLTEKNYAVESTIYQGSAIDINAERISVNGDIISDLSIKGELSSESSANLGKNVLVVDADSESVSVNGDFEVNKDGTAIFKVDVNSSEPTTEFNSKIIANKSLEIDGLEVPRIDSDIAHKNILEWDKENNKLKDSGKTVESIDKAFEKLYKEVSNISANLASINAEKLDKNSFLTEEQINYIMENSELPADLTTPADTIGFYSGPFDSEEINSDDMENLPIQSSSFNNVYKYRTLMNSYIWFCSIKEIDSITQFGSEIEFEKISVINKNNHNYNCYRTSERLTENLWKFEIEVS